MDHLAIIVRSRYHSHFICSNQIVYEKFNFSGFVVKSCRVAFCRVLQFTANILGSRKSAMIHSNRPLVFAPMVFVVLLCILIRILYSEENNRYHHQ